MVRHWVGFGKQCAGAVETVRLADYQSRESGTTFQLPPSRIDS